MNTFLRYFVNKIHAPWLFKFQYKYFVKDNYGMVITLHKITPADAPPNDEYNGFIEMKVDKLEALLKDLSKYNVEFVSQETLKRQLDSGKKPARPMVHLSFDDGYEDNYTLAFPVLQKYKIPFSLFVTTSFINDDKPFVWWYLLQHIIENEVPVFFEKYGLSVNENDYRKEKKDFLFSKLVDVLFENLEHDREYFRGIIDRTLSDSKYIIPMLTWEQIREMKESGICEIHPHTDVHPKFKNVDEQEKIDEITKSRGILQQELNITSSHFAYPYGAADDIGSQEDCREALQSAGVEMAFTTTAFLLNETVDLLFIPRVFFNNSYNQYTIKSRLNGTYQSRKMKDNNHHGSFKQ